MSEISTYTTDTVINDDDKWIGSDSAQSFVTRNFRAIDISDYVRGNIVIGDITSITATAAELNVLDGITSTTAELNILDGVTATASEINILDGVTATTTELNYVDGVTSSIQTQINAKQGTITGAATTVASTNLTADRALLSNASGKIAVSDITSTELGYLDGVTSSIQTQIDGIVEFEPDNTGNANQVLTKTSTGYQWSDAADASYTLTAATSSSLGGVIVPLSSDINVDSSGNITLGSLSANKITSGTFNIARIPDITAAKLDSGTATSGYVATADGSGGVTYKAASSSGHTIQEDGSDQTQRDNLNFSDAFTVTDDATNNRTTIDLATLTVGDIPNLPASKITSGLIDVARITDDTLTHGHVLAYNATDDKFELINLTDEVTFESGDDITFTGSVVFDKASGKDTVSFTDGIDVSGPVDLNTNDVKLSGLGSLPANDAADLKELRINHEGTLSVVDVPEAGSGDANVQSDWNETDNTQDSFIKNKPTIPSITVTSSSVSDGTNTFNKYTLPTNLSRLPDTILDPASIASDHPYALTVDASADEWTWRQFASKLAVGGVTLNTEDTGISYTVHSRTSATDNATDGHVLTANGTGGVAWEAQTDTQLTDAEVITAIVNSTAITDANKSTIRTNIGAGTSSLVIGTTATTALAGNTVVGDANVQSDWNVTDTASDAFIKNKPSIPSITVTSSSVSDGTNTFNKYVLPSLTTTNFAASALSTTSELTDDSDTTIPTTGWVKDQGYLTSNGITVTSTSVSDGTNTFNKAVPRTQEEVEDWVGGMVTGNTETGISVTYQDSDGTLDFAVSQYAETLLTDYTGTSGTTSATAGHVLTADGDGTVSWKAASGGGTFDQAGDYTLTGSVVFDKGTGENTVQFKDGLVIGDGSNDRTLDFDHNAGLAGDTIGEIRARSDINGSRANYSSIQTKYSSDGNADFEITVAGAGNVFDANGGTNSNLTVGNGITSHVTIGGGSTGHIEVRAPIRIGGTGTANELDDYEEGTWTPDAVNFTATDDSTDFSSASGHYTKVGDTVTFSATITIPANTDTSTIRFTLPFAPSSTKYQGTNLRHDVAMWNDDVSSGFSGVGHLNALNTIILYETSEGSRTSRTYVEESDDILYVNGTYFTDQ